MIVWEWINPMIEFLGNEYLGAESMFDEIKAEHKNSKYKIVVIDWWQFAPWWHYEKDGVSGDVFGGSNTLEIIKKVKEYDICFFMISEYWFQPRWNISSEAINAMIEELDKLNVFYISLSEDSLIHINESKNYETPWFIPNGSSIHVDDTFKLDFDYRPKDFTFNMLLGSERPHRTLFFELVGNEPYVYSTYFGHKKFRPKSSRHLEDDDILNNLSNQDISSSKLQTMSETVWRTWRNASISHIIPEKIYNNSHFDIVMESQPLLNTLNFTTEKTGKPLSTGRFFIWYDSPHKVEYLRQFGFELQDYLCYYDSIEDNVSRLASVMELIKDIGDNENYIKRIYEETKDARMHNQEVFKKLSRTYQSNISSWMIGIIGDKHG
jgi:hypothetical protein